MSKALEIYPWQSKVWGRLTQDTQHLPHALLLHGRTGIGKYTFACVLAKFLLCQHKSADDHACGVCASCHWFEDESHPDFRLLSPEQEPEDEDGVVATKKKKKKTQISVAQVRDLSDFIGLSSHHSGGLRIILIQPAEALNIASANALLKMLEEPAPGVVFILITHQLQRLLPTIISRCQKIAMPIPDAPQALEWLEGLGVPSAKEQLAYFEASPLKVLEAQEQFSQLAQVWQMLSMGNKLAPSVVAPLMCANSPEMGIVALQKWLYDMMSIKLSQQVRYHLRHAKALQLLAEKVNLARLIEMQKKSNGMRELALHPLNHELQMESLLHDYIKLFQS
ncbi:MAG: DNA polymerase III subunit delta' [Betaproteobacteria bacterium]|nr:DNA polymerase III subunit delta' [Betaproteobacteria bacterium]